MNKAKIITVWRAAYTVLIITVSGYWGLKGVLAFGYFLIGPGKTVPGNALYGITDFLMFGGMLSLLRMINDAVMNRLQGISGSEFMRQQDDVVKTKERGVSGKK